MPEKTPEKTFEECLSEITRVVDLYQGRWTLTCYSWQDVRQDILKHIFIKWSLYDQSKPLPNWVARVTQSQIKNALRDKYYIYQPPCLRCPMHLGEGGCKLYGEVSTKCPSYKKFMAQKGDAANLYFPVSYDNSEYSAHHQFSYNASELISNLYLRISGVECQIFKMFHESGLSTTKIARNIQVSGMDFRERFTFVQESLKSTEEKAKEILQDAKIASGL